MTIAPNGDIYISNEGGTGIATIPEVYEEKIITTWLFLPANTCSANRGRCNSHNVPMPKPAIVWSIMQAQVDAAETNQQDKQGKKRSSTFIYLLLVYSSTSHISNPKNATLMNACPLGKL